MEDKFESLISLYVFESSDISQFQNKVKQLLEKEINSIKSIPLNESYVDKHKRKLMELKDIIVQSNNPDLMLESAIETLHAIDSLESLTNNGKQFWLQVGIENKFCNENGELI